MSSTAIGSTPAKGSSSKINFGSEARQRAISVLLRSPPESKSPILLRTCPKPNSSSNVSSFSSLSFFPDKIISVDGKGEILLNVYPSGDPAIVRSLNRRVDVVVSYLDPATVSETNLKDTSGPIVLNNVHFISGYSYLTRGSKKTLSSLAKTLSKESFSFEIQGHVCCTEGKIDALDKKTNERNLSVARAKYVYDYFLEKGIEKSRMSFEGFGHRFPLGGSADKDRRVEIVVSSN